MFGKLEDTRRVAIDTALIVAGSFVFAFGLNAFEVPYGLAAGGLTGLAQIIQTVGLGAGLNIPIGLQVIVINALLMIPVLRSGGLRYAWRTLLGILASSLFVDLQAPWVPALGDGDLLLCSLWGGVVCGAGLGLAFRGGGNTGGSDIIAQILARRGTASVGTVSLIIDFVVIGISIPIFSLENALYATVAMFVGSHAIDYVVDGPRTEKAAWIVSDEYQAIEREVLEGLNRGCTRVKAKGSYSGAERPMLFVILNRRQVPHLKAIVRDMDSNAILVITDVHEVFGEGFHDIGDGA